MKHKTYDLIVVGAGVVGTFHAYFAAKAGAKVLLLERNPAPNEATVRNFGMVATTTIAAGGEWDTNAKATNRIYRALAAEIPDDLTLRPKGSLYLVETDAEDQLIREFAALAPGIGKNAEYLDRQVALSAFPFARTDYLRGALLLPDDMSVDPRQFIHRVLKYCVDTSLLEYKAQTPIVQVHSDGKSCQLTDAGGNIYSTSSCFICNGVEYRMLFPDIFAASPLQISKLQMIQTIPQPSTQLPHNIMSGLTLRRYPAFSVCPSYQAFQASPFDEDYRKWGIHLLFKQADDGTVIIGDSHEYFSLARGETISFDLEATIHEAILSYGKRMIHLDTWKIGRAWNGYYMSHPTEPVYQQQIEENLRIITGIGGKGMSTAAGFAQKNISNWTAALA